MTGPAVVVRRLRVDPAAPEPLFERIAAGAEYAYWLDSSSARDRRGGAASRYSVLGVASGAGARVLRYETAGLPEPVTDVLEPDAGTRTPRRGSVLELLAEEAGKGEAPGADPGEGPAAGPDAGTSDGTGLTAPEGAPPILRNLLGGYVGYLGYEMKADLGSPNRHLSQTPDAVWIRVSRCVVLDHLRGEAWGLGDAGWLEGLEAPASYAGGAAGPPSVPGAGDVVLPTPDRTDYLQAVQECLAEICDGNSYEICLTAETSARLGVGLSFEVAWGLYRAQRAANPAPHAAFLWCGDHAVLSSSPERFLSVDEDGWCEAKPIKGTAPRSPDPRTDAERAAALAADPKTRAENLMIVDLMRNDLSRVCDPATVQVPVLMGVESYATVHQLVSTVRGRLRAGATALDAVASCFPGGSMTGAPKARTMEIIERLEGRARGVYSGAVGYLGPGGAADLSIVIRTAVLSTPAASEPDAAVGALVRIAAGGAIVADSDPHEEYEEMLAKLRAPLPPGWRLG
ncbi:anthranilate synthase component I family protein [Rothia halotolerans]|uniref:anthranilate synthase component I family protein n=1 Tax=Rothia halotolerans TaxID=405770 RepID=UPI00101C6351|nr:anthranilate synthase component I family protein [Rothia halotolerans]